MYLAYGYGIDSGFDFGALCTKTQPCDAVVFAFRYGPSLPLHSKGVTKLGVAQGRNVHVTVTEESVLIRVDSFLDFRLMPFADRIECEALRVVSVERLRYWAVQHILPIYMILKEVAEFLHGMAVSDSPCGALSSEPEESLKWRQPGRSGCIGFLGESFAGKSTLLSYFLERGHVLVADDHIALSRRNYLDVFPATPYYRPYRESEDLGIAVSRFSPEPTALQHLFLLEPAPSYADIEVEELHGITAVSALLRHVQYNLHNPDLPHFFPLVAERFHGLNQLVRQVPIRRLYVPRDMKRLPEVYDLVHRIAMKSPAVAMSDEVNP